MNINLYPYQTTCKYINILIGRRGIPKEKIGLSCAFIGMFNYIQCFIRTHIEIF